MQRSPKLSSVQEMIEVVKTEAEDVLQEDATTVTAMTEVATDDQKPVIRAEVDVRAATADAEATEGKPPSSLNILGLRSGALYPILHPYNTLSLHLHQNPFLTRLNNQTTIQK